MDHLLLKVRDYYNDKIRQFGTASKGVDWNGPESHFLRFKQLIKIITDEEYSVLDYGCGYGALIDYLDTTNRNFNYTGYDIAEEMINAGTQKYLKRNNVYITGDIDTIAPHDYCIGNGLFNVKLDADETEWKKYIITTLDKMNQLSLKGFSFNILTAYSDSEFMKDYLFYAEPAWLFHHCKVNYSKQIALLHDYPLYEFTILVKK
jgi:SAM-dependent methyltransferase